MKLQDILFFIFVVIILFTRNSRLSAILGILLLVLSLPLFALWVFFTAERFTWYAGAFFFISVILTISKMRKQIHNES